MQSLPSHIIYIINPNCKRNNKIVTDSKHLIIIIKNGIELIETKSKLRFIQKDPKAILLQNVTYLNFMYSAVKEKCCLPLYPLSCGKRVSRIILTTTYVYFYKNEYFVIIKMYQYKNCAAAP